MARRLQAWAGRRSALPFLILLLGLVAIGLVKERVGATPPYVLGHVTVGIGDVPAFLQGREEEVTRPFASLDQPRSLLDPDLPAVIRKLAAASPWVREVHTVRRVFPRTLAVELVLRQPVGVVCIGGERLLVDQDGVVLERDTPLTVIECPEIALGGEPLREVPRVGFAFPPGGVQEATAVLADLRRHRLHESLATFRIVHVRVGRPGAARRVGAGDIELVLDTGAIVRWGRAPNSPYAALEETTGHKLDALARVLRAHPGLVGLAAVDVRFRDPRVTPAG